jgi:lipopolysaccharide transport system permease protein
MMPSSAPITVITARGSSRLWQFFLDVWHYRDLFVSFLERDIKLRYKQTAFGVTWVVAQPLITSGVFTVIFGGLTQMGTDDLPHMLFYMSGMVPWICFQQGLTNSAASLELNAGLISKVYFPRMLVPAASIIGTLPDFAIGFALLNAVAALTGHWGWMLLAMMPVLLLMQLAAAAGLGFFLTALNAQYRDVKYAIPFIVNLGLFFTPILYSMKALLGIRPEAEIFQWFNPVAGVITTYRWILGAPDPPSVELLAANAVCSGLYFLAGLAFFRWREARLVDVL